MSSIDRPLSGATLRFSLADERARVGDPAILARSGRNARTLAKEGGLRLTMVAVAPGGEIPEHRADGPVSVHVLDGSIRVFVDGDEHLLHADTLLTLPPGRPHTVSSDDGGTFLLTVCPPAPAE